MRTSLLTCLFEFYVLLLVILMRFMVLDADDVVLV